MKPRSVKQKSRAYSSRCSLLRFTIVTKYGNQFVCLGQKFREFHICNSTVVPQKLEPKVRLVSFLNTDFQLRDELGRCARETLHGSLPQLPCPNEAVVDQSPVLPLV